MDKISKDKQYTTRKGRPYRCYATDGGGEFPVHGAILVDDRWRLSRHTAHGKFLESGDDQCDLIEIKPRIKIERWVLVERDGSYSLWLDKPSKWSSGNAFAITRITFEVEEGEGLDAV
jgi:hypothetical protein